MVEGVDNGQVSAAGPDAGQPTIVVKWDRDRQSVDFEFSTTQFKNWDFVHMILRAATEKAVVMAGEARAQQRAIAAAKHNAMRVQPVRGILKG